MDEVNTNRTGKGACEVEKYANIRERVEEDLAGYHTYVSDMKSLEDRILKLKMESDIPVNDVIESISFSAGILDENLEYLGPDKTALAGISYPNIQKRMRDEVLQTMYIEYKTLQQKIWFIEKCITSLPAEQFEILSCLILNGWTYEATARELAIGKKKISELKKKAIENLTHLYQKYQSYC